jgi:hypothetical protein
MARNERKQKMDPNEFHWQSDLSARRKQAICEWFNSLEPKHQRMVKDLMDDAREDEAYRYEEGPDS